MSGNQISVTVGQHRCIISSQTDNVIIIYLIDNDYYVIVTMFQKMTCDAQIPSQFNQKLTMVVMVCD